MDGKKTRIVSESGKYIEVMVPIVSKAGKQNHILGAVQATVPSEDMMGAVTEMEHRRNMLLVACHLWIINGNDHQLSADERFKEDSERC